MGLRHDQFNALLREVSQCRVRLAAFRLLSSDEQWGVAKEIREAYELSMRLEKTLEPLRFEMVRAEESALAIAMKADR